MAGGGARATVGRDATYRRVAPARCNNPELGKMGPDRIDHRGLLTDEEMARAVEHQAALLLGCLG